MSRKRKRFVFATSPSSSSPPPSFGQMVPGRQVVFHDFQFEGAVKRMVRNGAHLWPIDPMPALISTTLHNLCTCASIKTPASRKAWHRVKYEPGSRSITLHNLCAFGLRTFALSRKRERFEGHLIIIIRSHFGLSQCQSSHNCRTVSRKPTTTLEALQGSSSSSSLSS